MNVSRILDISARALATYQRAINVTSHNLSNANNEKYTRQNVTFVSDGSDILGGMGVTIKTIERVRNNLLDTQLRYYNTRYYDSEKRSNILTQLEAILTEPSENGLSNYINTFFDSWSKLSVNPTSTALRSNVIHATTQMTNKIKAIYDGFEEVRKSVYNDLEGKLNDVNFLLKDISELNRKIFETQIKGGDANDLMDLRDKSIDELSQLANITVTWDKEGSANITIGGLAVADRYNAEQIKFSLSDGKVTLTSFNGAFKLALNGGELYALTDYYNNKIPSYLDTLDSISTTIMNKVNELHKKGYSLHNPPLTNIEFFSSYLAGELKINQNILKDPSYIAVSEDQTNGNGDIARQIASLKNEKILDNKTVSEKYFDMVSELGSDKKAAEQTMASNEVVLEQLETQKASYSGVSIDEEMTKLIKYQRSYEAAARLIKVADELMQTLINSV